MKNLDSRFRGNDRVVMIRSSITLLCLLSFPAFAGEWLSLQPGLGYLHFDVAGSPVHAFQVDPKILDIKPLYENNFRPETIRTLTENKALVGINANFFDLSGKPLGLVVSNGKTVNPFKNISWWGVFQMGFKAEILHSTSYQPSPSIFTAIQAGPRLLDNEHNLKLKEQVSKKTAIGIDRRGNVILVVTELPVSVSDFSKFLALPVTRGGPGCVQALNLDGGSSSQLYAHVENFELDLQSFVKIPVGLGVFKK